ncbi:MAG: hypothetical protein K8R21_03610, partial [Leptospira sp.]|nr:hypothetical protein [Leptospira sp.]
AFFATPIVYSEGLVKDKGMIGFVVSNLNPVSFFVKIYRNALVGTEVVTQTELISVALISILVFYSGYYIFLKTKSFIVDML